MTSHQEVALLKEIRREQLKRSAQLRARMAFEHAQARIDLTLDVIEPDKAEIKRRMLERQHPQKLDA